MAATPSGRWGDLRWAEVGDGSSGLVMVSFLECGCGGVPVLGEGCGRGGGAFGVDGLTDGNHGVHYVVREVARGAVRDTGTDGSRHVQDAHAAAVGGARGRDTGPVVVSGAPEFDVAGEGVGIRQG